MNIIEIIDANEEKTFHPSLDIKDNILVLGFRIKKERRKIEGNFVFSPGEKIGSENGQKIV